MNLDKIFETNIEFKLKPGTIILPQIDKIVIFNSQNKLAIKDTEQNKKFLRDLVGGISQKELKDAYSELFNVLQEKGFLVESTIKEKDIDPYYERLITYLSRFEPNVNRFEAFNKLRNSKIAIIGLGGLGTWLVQSLLMVGIKEFVLIDGDTVDKSNFNRQLFWEEDDIGRLKVDIAQREIHSKRRNVKVETFTTYIQNADDMTNILKSTQPDLVITCADQPQWHLRRWINQACLEMDTPHLVVSGSKIGPFVVPNQSACIECQWLNVIRKNPYFETELKKFAEIPQQKNGSMVSEPMNTVAFATKEVFNFLTGTSGVITVNNEITLKNYNEGFSKQFIHQDITCKCYLKGGVKHGKNE